MESILQPVDPEEEQYGGFEITDDLAAEWAIQTIKDAQSDTAKWQSHFSNQLAAIKRKNDETVANMTAFLAHYFGKVPHQTTKTQAKYELPSATLMLKQQQPEFKFQPDDLVAYFDAAGLNDYVKVERKPMWGEFKKRTTVSDGALVDNETGEIVKCVEIVPRQASFDVKLKGE